MAYSTLPQLIAHDDEVHAGIVFYVLAASLTRTQSEAPVQHFVMLSSVKTMVTGVFVSVSQTVGNCVIVGKEIATEGTRFVFFVCIVVVG